MFLKTVVFLFVVISLTSCDQPDDVIGHIFGVGGVKTEENEFPHMAALGYGDPPKFLCGGSLIHDRFVLTAAHCVKSKDNPVRIARLGTRDINEINNYTQDFPISEIILHPDFKPPSSYHDIALLKLQNKVKFSQNVLPARMEFTPELDPNIKTLMMVGWGKDGFLGTPQGRSVKVILDVTNSSYCRRQYQNKKYQMNLPKGILDDFQVCAGGKIGVDSCQGDSGGPLEYIKDKRHIIVGVVSVGKACGLSTSPGIYTRVSGYFKWIIGKISS